MIVNPPFLLARGRPRCLWGWGGWARLSGGRWPRPGPRPPAWPDPRTSGRGSRSWSSSWREPGTWCRGTRGPCCPFFQVCPWMLRPVVTPLSRQCFVRGEYYIHDQSPARGALTANWLNLAVPAGESRNKRWFAVENIVQKHQIETQIKLLKVQAMIKLGVNVYQLYNCTNGNVNLVTCHCPKSPEFNRKTHS